jgi:nucleoside-diphosphate-sugar epimerase
MRKRATVTGASGFVGANLVRRLLEAGHEVHVMLRPGYRAWRLQEVLPHLRVDVVDLGNPEKVRAVVAGARPDWIFHLAAYGAYADQTDVDQMVATNISATVNLVRAGVAAGFEAFVNIGSSSEYGFKEHAPSEDEVLEPNSDYAVTKASATLYCRSTAIRLRVPITTLRLYSVYGPYEEPKRLIPTLLVRGLDGRWPPLVDPAVARDFVFTDDVTDACLRAATRPGSSPGAIYNIGTGRQTTVGEVVSAVKDLLAISLEPSWGSMPRRVWDTASWVADNRRAVAALDWRPDRSLKAGLAATLDWLQQNPDRLRWYRECLEVRR